MTKPGPKAVTPEQARKTREEESRKTLAWIARQALKALEDKKAS